MNQGWWWLLNTPYAIAASSSSGGGDFGNLALDWPGKPGADFGDSSVSAGPSFSKGTGSVWVYVVSTPDINGDEAELMFLLDQAGGDSVELGALFAIGEFQWAYSPGVAGVPPATFPIITCVMPTYTGKWTHFLFNWNRANTSATILIDGSVTTIGTFGTWGSIGNPQLVRFFAGLDGHVYDYWLDLTTAMDITNSATREKFILAGKPVDLGVSGANPLGTPPSYFFSIRAGGSAGDFKRNRGTAVWNLGALASTSVYSIAASTPFG